MNALSIRTHQHFIRHDKARGDREFFVTSVQPELSGQGGGNPPGLPRHRARAARAVREGGAVLRHRGAVAGGALT
jgi:hypothetical protein